MDGVGPGPGLTFLISHPPALPQGPFDFRLANALSALYPKDSMKKELLDATLLAVLRYGKMARTGRGGRIENGSRKAA